MSVLVDIDFEAGNLSEFSGSVTDGGDLSVSTAAKLAGSNYGLNCLLDDSNAIYGYWDPANSTTGKLRFRFYFDPNSLSMANGNEISLVDNSSSTTTVTTVKLKYNNGYQIYAIANNDSGQSQTTAYAITDEPHYIEVYLTRATTTSSNDGTLTLWIDGTQKEAITTLDNNTAFANFDWGEMGAIPNASLNGTIYLDQLVINDDGGAIGPIASTPTVTPAEATQSQTSDAASVSIPGSPVSITPSEATQSQTSDAASVSKSGGVIVDHDFNANLGTWYGSSDPDGHMTWSNDATAQSLANTAGAAKVSILDGNNTYYYEYLSPANTSGVWRARFYIDPNSCPWSNNVDVEVLVGQGNATSGGEVLIIKFGKTVGGDWDLELLAQDDASDYVTSGKQVITDAPHWVECEVRRSDGSNNGRARLWIDTLAAPVYDSGAIIDNDVNAADCGYFPFGAFQTPQYVEPGGAIYLDELIINDTGAAIGPKASSVSVTPSEATQSQASDAATVTLGKQYLFPSVDVDAGAWATAPLSTKVDDWNDISDYITLSNNATGTCTLGTLIRTMDGGVIADPLVSTGHSLKWYSRRTTTNRTTTLVYTLQQGVSAIAAATVTYSSGSAWTAGTLDLSAAQADAITDYRDLRVNIACTATGTGNAPQVAAVWFEFPLYVNVSQWTITPAESTQTQTSDAPTLITTVLTTPAESAQGQASDSAITKAVYPLTPGEAAQGQVSDAATVKTIGVVNAGESTQAQTSDAVVLKAVYVLTPGEAAQSQTSDAASLTYGSQATVTPGEAVQSQTSDAASVRPVYLLTAGESTQAQTSDAATVGFSGISSVTITPAEAQQAQTSGGATLIPIYKLSAGEANQAQVSDSATLNFTAPSWTVTPAEATQGQTSDAVALAVVYLLTAGEATQAQISDAADVKMGDLILHGNRRLYRMTTRAAGETDARNTNRVSTRVTVEVDD